MKLVKIPLNTGGLSKKNGVETAPDAVVKSIKKYYMKESGILHFFDVDEVKVDNSNIEESNNLIFNKIKELDVPAIIIGGDHSLTYSSF